MILDEVVHGLIATLDEGDRGGDLLAETIEDSYCNFRISSLHEERTVEEICTRVGDAFNDCQNSSFEIHTVSFCFDRSIIPQRLIKVHRFMLVYLTNFAVESHEGYVLYYFFHGLYLLA